MLSLYYNESTTFKLWLPTRRDNTNKCDVKCESASLYKFFSLPFHAEFNILKMRFKVTLSGKPTHNAPITCVGWSSTEEVYSAG